VESFGPVTLTVKSKRSLNMKKSSTSMLAFLIIAVFGLTGFSAADFDLTGTITDSNNAPVAGAVVSIYTARPRVGAGIL
jgi:protocatechuate 3,4-dioxygenase beta subunit